MYIPRVLPLIGRLTRSKNMQAPVMYTFVRFLTGAHIAKAQRGEYNALTMEFNKIISLVLGFVVIILLFVWISNQFRANTTNRAGASVSPTQTATPTPTTVTPAQTEETRWNPLGFLFNRQTPTPTPPTPVARPTGGIDGQQGGTPRVTPVTIEVVEGVTTPRTPTTTTKGGIIQAPAEIPQTGSPTFFIPLILSLGGLGIYIKKKI